MLINPWIPLKEEIILITGITEKMLEGRERWENVRDRVREFIGDAIIVGHNVLFDISMLSSHSIDLSANIALDTFELSELFSQDAESLNLLFLAKKYGIDVDWEHRALDDTRLSLWLFLYYLERLSSMNCLQSQILSTFIERDTQSIIITLLDIVWCVPQKWYIFHYRSEIIKSMDNHTFPTDNKWRIVCHNLSGNMTEEEYLIQKLLSEHSKVIIYTHSPKQSLFWWEYLQSIGVSTCFLLPPERFCSLAALGEFISKSKMSRKEIIFSIKMLFWLEQTTTWLLDELKFYGEERRYMKFMELWTMEYSDFREKHRAFYTDAQVLIGNTFHPSFDSLEYTIGDSATMVRDAYRMEDIYRKQETRVISFSEIDEYFEILETVESLWIWFFESIRFSLQYFEHILTHIHTRPTGDLPNPPWDYGETYYFDQDTLWRDGWRWLMICIQSIIIHLENRKEKLESLTWFEKRIFQHCIRSIEVLIEITKVKNENASLIVSIIKNETRLSIIPRDVSGIVRKYVENRMSKLTHLTNYGKGGVMLGSFMRNECGIDWPDVNIQSQSEHVLNIWTDLRKLIESWTVIVILSTSNKHLRSLMNEVKKYFDGKIFTQGISGWKWKILSLFEQQVGKKILLGIIDSWIDELVVWKHCDTVILAKMPFDPPTDPYYLARTVWMRNNFEDYSCPIALAKINTLIGRVRLSNGQAKLFCLDDRFVSTLWGGKIFQEVL